MATRGAPAPAPAENVVFPDWAMLDRRGRTGCHNDPDAPRVAVKNKKNKTVARVDMDGGLSCYLSFTIEAPQKGISYIWLHWPELDEQGSDDPPGYAYVRATDEDLILFDITIHPSGPCYVDTPADLFVYKAAGISPSVQPIPPCTEDSDWTFLMTDFTTGILRLTEDHYIVADLKVTDHETKGTHAQLCVFNSVTKVWKITGKMPAPQPQDQSNGGHQFPSLWSSDNVLAFDSRFLCWIDYFSGILLCDFSSKIDSPALRYVPFPGENEYNGEARVERCFPDRFRSVSISRGKIRFVHIDNDYHERLHNGRQYLHLPDGQQQPHHTITIWTLNSKFKWVPYHVINLRRLWKQPDYQALDIHERLPELPIMSVDDPDVLCCLLREKDWCGKGWMIMLDNHASLRSCTPESEDTKARYYQFPTIPILPTVFCKYLERPTGQWASRRDEAEPATSENSEQKGVGPVRKRKQSQIALALEDYIDFQKKQSATLVEEFKESMPDDLFSIGNCVAVLEPMEELSIAEKAKALRLFKCPMNREIFINTKNPSLRIFWLKEEINAMERS